MREHAKDPWSVGTAIIDGDPVTAIFDRNGDEICNMGNSLLDEDANACRIVACVNACAGIPSEKLERGGLEMPLLHTLADIRAVLGVGEKPMLSELAGIVERIKRERDAAVEALGEIVEVATLRGDNDLPHPADDQKTWTARMQTAWDDAEAVLAEMDGKNV